MASQGDRYFVSGETVVVRAKVSKPGTKIPTDPAAIVFATVIREGDSLPTVIPGSFVRMATGDYTFSIATDNLSLGVYYLTIRVSGPLSETPVKAVLVTDNFILKAA